MKKLKKLDLLFWSALGGVGFCLVMTVFTAVQQHRVQKAIESAPLSIPLPAEAPAAPAGGAAGTTE